MLLSPGLVMASALPQSFTEIVYTSPEVVATASKFVRMQQTFM
jgi:hypothetical protein